jgi:hypothetical protein
MPTVASAALEQIARHAHPGDGASTMSR